MTPGASSGHLLVRAARGEAVERPPVWAMRQAGRWDPEFNRIRAGRPFYQFSEDVELSAVPEDWGPSVRRYRYVYSDDHAVELKCPFEDCPYARILYEPCSVF